MQSAVRSCGRVARLVSQAAAGAQESSAMITHAGTSVSSGICSCSYVSVPAPLTSLQACLQLPAANQKQIDAETRAAWPQLSREQKKQELKPEKNRNHFKRMWKKDLQIKHAHQARKRQQAAADALRQKTLQEKWLAGASMWRGNSNSSAVTGSQ